MNSLRWRDVLNGVTLAGVAAMTVACAGRVHAGYAGSVTPGGAGSAIQGSVHADLFGLGAAARGKVGPNLFSVAAGPELGLQALPEFNGPISPTISGGIHLVQLDVTQKQVSFGMGSPFLMMGLSYCSLDRKPKSPDEIFCLSVNGNIDHHVRFGHPDETFLGLSFGITGRTGSYE